MNTKKNKPFALTTRWEVLRFKLNRQHRIPRRHHLNLVSLIGCDLNTFDRYIKNEHSLSEDAINLMISSPECTSTLLVWFRFYRNKYFVQKHMAKIISRLGIETFLKYGHYLSEDYTHMLLVENKIDLISKYMRQMSFTEADKKLLLEKHNIEFTLCFLKTCYSLSEAAETLLTYDEKEVFEAYFALGNSPAVRRGVIVSKPVEIFKALVNSPTFENFTFDEFQLIIQRNDIEILKCCKRDALTPEEAQYVCDYGSDEVFNYFITRGSFPCNSDIEFSRLSQPKHRDLLLKYLQKYSLSTAETEIQLLKSKDEELINIYFANHQFKTETNAYILVNGLAERYGITYDDISPRDWKAEALIFSTGNEIMIEQYLFAGNVDSEGLTEFGEALLFHHAPLEILDVYMDYKTPGKLAQHAIINRWDTGLLNLFLYKHDFLFNNHVVVDFLKKADTEMVLKYLQEIVNLSHFLTDECPMATTCLCEKQDAQIYRLLLDMHILLDNNDMVLFIRHAPIKYIFEFLENNELYPTAEAELLKRNNKELTLFYLQKYSINLANEKLLFSFLDTELIDAYRKNNPTGYFQSYLY